jgi:hypothetical protein
MNTNAIQIVLGILIAIALSLGGWTLLNQVEDKTILATVQSKISNIEKDSTVHNDGYSHPNLRREVAVLDSRLGRLESEVSISVKRLEERIQSSSESQTLKLETIVQRLGSIERLLEKYFKSQPPR